MSEGSTLAPPKEKIAPLDSQQVTIGDTTFHINKLMPEHSFELFNRLLNGAGEALGDLLNIDPVNLAGNTAAQLVLGTKIAISMPAEVLSMAKSELFSAVTFTDSNHPMPVPLQGGEDAAFDGKSGLRIWELVVRSFFVTFIEWYDDAQSLSAAVEGMDLRQLLRQI